MYTLSQIQNLIDKNNISAFYNDRHWRRLAKSIIAEQHGECQYCKSKGKYSLAVLVHHAKELKKYPELAYSKYYIDKHGERHKQLVALCQSCHEEQHPDRFKKQNKKHFTNEERW